MDWTALWIPAIAWGLYSAIREVAKRNGGHGDDAEFRRLVAQIERLKDDHSRRTGQPKQGSREDAERLARSILEAKRSGLFNKEERR
jgi:hypothetical protein